MRRRPAALPPWPAGLLPVPRAAQLKDCIATLEEAAEDITQHAQPRPAGGEGGAGAAPAAPAAAGLLDVQGVHVAAAAEGAYATLLLLRRWAAAPGAAVGDAAGPSREAAGAGEADRAQLSTQLLELCR